MTLALLLPRRQSDVPVIPGEENPLPTVTVWDQSGATWQMVGVLDSLESLSVELRHNHPGVWSAQMRFSTQAELLTKSRAVVFDFRGKRFTGIIERLSPQSDETGRPILEVGGQGALSLLGDVICYPDPTAGAAAQLITHYRATGAAETVLRQLIVAQYVTRRGGSLTIPASSGRGDTVTVNLFFDNLLEVVMKQARRGGIGVRMGLVNTTDATHAAMRLTFYLPTDRSREVYLSHKVGTLRTWKSDANLPAATRAVVGAAIAETPYTVTAVSTTDNTMTVGASHHFKTGSLVRFRGGGTTPAPLDDGTAYFAIRVDANTFKVAKTRAKALANTPISLTSAGSGTIKVTEVARIVGEYVDTAAETSWGRQRETFVDARDEDSDDTTVINERGKDALEELGEQSSFELEATDTVGMRALADFDVGDLVTVELLAGLSSVERLNGVSYSLGMDGMTVSLLPGNPDARNPMFQQAAITRAMRRRLRNLEQGES